MVMPISITLYAAAVFLTLYIVNHRVRIHFGGKLDNMRKKSRISYTEILLIVFLFVLYNVFVTATNLQIGGDRGNYTHNFFGIRKSTAGINVIIYLIRLFTDNVHWLFYLSTFVALFAVLYAYKIDEEAVAESLVLLFCTQYVFFSLNVVKQTFANACVIIGISFLLRNKGKKDRMLALLWALLAMQFHPSGFFAIPLYILILIPKTKNRLIVFFIIIGVAMLIFEPFMVSIAGVIAPLAPGIASKITDYIGESAKESLADSGLGIVIKGTPFFIVTLWGILNRAKYRRNIRSYDEYLVLSGMLSVIYLVSFYNGWIYRLAYYLYFFEGAFFAKMMKQEEKKGNRVPMRALVYGINALFTIRYIIICYSWYGTL